MENTATKKTEHFVIEGDSFYHIEKEIDSSFKVWRGGGCIGRNVETIEEARKVVFDYAKSSIKDKIEKLQSEIDVANKSLKALGTDEFNLAIFKNPNYHGYECNFFNGKKG